VCDRQVNARDLPGRKAGARVDRRCPGLRRANALNRRRQRGALAARVSRAWRKPGRKRQKRDRRSRAPQAEATPAKAAPLGPLGATEDTRGIEATGLLPQPTGAGGSQQTTAVEGQAAGLRRVVRAEAAATNSRGVRRQRGSSANSLPQPSKSRPERRRCRPQRRKRRVVAHAAERSWEMPAVATPSGK